MVWPEWIELLPLSRKVQSFPQVKGQHRLRRKMDLFLASEGRPGGTSRRACSSSDERAPATSRKATDKRAQTGASSDKRQISFLVSAAAATGAVREQGHG